MRKYIFISLTFACSLSMILFTQTAGYARDCKFEKDGRPAIGVYHIVLQISAGTVRKIKGAVNFNYDEKNAATGAKVLVYKLAADEASFVGWQEVDDKAEFCFGKLPPGRYKLEVGFESPSGVNVTTILLTLEPDNIRASDKKIKVPLKPGT